MRLVLLVLPAIFLQQPQGLDQGWRAGVIGSVEMQDLIFTTRGAMAGAILIEWNLEAAYQGAAGLWDCHDPARDWGALCRCQLCPRSTAMRTTRAARRRVS